MTIVYDNQFYAIFSTYYNCENTIGKPEFMSETYTCWWGACVPGPLSRAPHPPSSPLWARLTCLWGACVPHPPSSPLWARLTCWWGPCVPGPLSRVPRPPSSPSSAAFGSRRSRTSAWTACSQTSPARGPRATPRNKQPQCQLVFSNAPKEA